MPDDDDRPRDHGHFYLNIIRDLVGGGLSTSENRYGAPRDRAPSKLGGDDTEQARDRKLAARLALAQDLLTRLPDHRPPAYPDRPAILPLTNVTLVGHLAGARRMGSRASAADREVADAFGHWRYELAKLEGVSAGRLEMVLYAHAAMAEVAAKGGDVLGAELQQVELFVHRHWGLRPPFPSPRDTAIVMACRQTELMPTWLMNGTKMPGRFVPQEHADFDPRGSHGSTEDDDGDVPF